MARSLDQIAREVLGAKEWDMIVVIGELDRLRDIVAAKDAEIAALTAPLAKKAKR